MDAKETWIQRVENSLEGLKPAEPNPYLYFKIMNRLENPLKEVTPVKMVWLTAASLLLLAMMNFAALTSLTPHGHPDKNELQSLSGQLQLMNTNTIDYR